MLDALERAEAEAQDAEARMRTFLADASHDLRTPIAGVINTAERLLQDSHSRAERERRLVSLVREAQRAGRLVDDLLLMTRLGDAGGQLGPAVRLESVALGPLVELAVERTALLAPRRAVRVEVADAGWARCDRDAVDRILANLLGNARTATAEGDEITVRAQTRGAWVVVEVADSGPGVPPADRERIFDRFVRLNPARSRSPHATAAGNAGLGLPIARALARAMGGDLTCAAADRGAIFRLTVPAETVPAETMADRAQWRPDADSGALISIGSSPSTSRQRPV
jgi:signal transduction histidine kinase